ncbi:inosine triphosphate pyrophosphatase-like [Ptychodera flava]|uniref:inosine triphosphate pyrophosphatase-like n=1 Tax=Ptychodera flava TaxID=63121 RepID=UPI003969DA36
MGRLAFDRARRVWSFRPMWRNQRPRNMHTAGTDTVVFVTGNDNKLQEVISVLAGKFNFVSKKLDIPEYQGEPDDVSIAKCKQAARQVGGAVLVEDTCLGFNALGGLPGPYIKHFFEKLGSEGLHRLLAGFEDKSAVTQCTFAYCDGYPSENIQLFKATLEGTIVSPMGPNVFGFDSCFVPIGYNQTYSMMPEELQRKLSPRAKALQCMADYFLKGKLKDTSES